MRLSKPFSFVVTGCLILFAANFLTGCASDTELIEPKPLPDIKRPLKAKKAWSKDIGGELAVSRGKLRALVLADRVIGVDARSRITALSLEKGKEIWSLELNAAFGSGLGGDSQHLVYAGLDGQIYLIDAQSGDLIWQAQASSEVLSVPAISRNKVIAQSVDGSVQAFHRDSGQLAWRYQVSIPLLTLRGTSSPKIWNNRVLAGFSNGKLVSLDIDNGELVWERELSVAKGRTELERLVDLDGDFLVKDDVAYALNFQGKVAAIELYTGRELWSERISSVSGLSEFAGQLFVTDDQGHLWALNSRTGNTLWSTKLFEARDLSAPVAMGTFLVVSDYEGYIHWLDLESGEVRSRQRAGKAPISVTPSWTTDQIITISADAKVLVLGLPK